MGQTKEAKENQNKMSKEDMEKQLQEAQAALAAIQEKAEAEAKAKADTDETTKKKADDEKRQQLLDEADLKKLLAVDDGEELKKKNVEDLSNREVIDIMANAVETALKASREQAGMDADEKVKELGETVGTIKQILISMRASELVDSAKAKYEDFGEYQDDVRELVTRVYPGMTPEHAYMIAKSTRSATGDTKSRLASERPDASLPASVGGHREVNKESLKDMTPRRRFNEVLNNAVDKYLTGRKEA